MLDDNNKNPHNIEIFENFIRDQKKLYITTHIIPDADGIGSEIALCYGLESLGIDVQIVHEEPLLERYLYLDPKKKIQSITQIKDIQSAPWLVVDTNSHLRVGTKVSQSITNHATSTLYIDHHPCSKDLLKSHVIDTRAAATGELVALILKYFNIEFNKDIALALYSAIIIDTSSFRYPTVRPLTHQIVAELLSTGIKPSEVFNGINGTKKISHLHHLGRILSSAEINARESIAWITIKEKDMNEFSTDIEDTHGFINNLLILENVKVVCMFRDDGHFVKASLRSSGDYDVGLIAMAIGGGGHSHSAASVIAKLDKSLETIIKECIQTIETIIHD